MDLSDCSAVSKPTELGTVFGMTALYVVLPILLTFLIAARWPNLSALALTVINIALIGVGAYVFSRVFGD